MAFADYEFYMNEYRGNSIPESDFDRLEAKAAFEVDRRALNRARVVIGAEDNADLIEKIRMATCEVAEVMFSYSVSAGISPVVASEKVGDHSVQFVDTEKRRDSMSADIAGAIERYLELSGLMFRGVA